MPFLKNPVMKMARKREPSFFLVFIEDSILMSKGKKQTQNALCEV